MAKVIGAVVGDNEECKGCGLCVVACHDGCNIFHSEVSRTHNHVLRMVNKIGDLYMGTENMAAISSGWSPLFIP